LAKGSASEFLVRRAQRELQSCAAYLRNHFVGPLNPVQKQGKKLATARMRRLAAAIEDRHAAAIAKESTALSKVVIYLWALKQFGSGDDE
jgi:hypothetical protein